LLIKLIAKSVYILALSRDIDLVPYLEVYRPVVFISLVPLVLLGSLDSLIGSFLHVIHPLSELYCFVLRELFSDTYGFVSYRPQLVKTYIGDIA
jgi:hypothetical protein